MSLRLAAQDEEDLRVVSAAVQDAVLTLGDIAYDPRGRVVTLGLNRFRWEATGKGGERIRSGLQIAGVLSVASRKLRRGAPAAVVSLLSIAYEAGDPPGGTINLTFAGGGDLRLQVECIDAVLADLSTPWPTPRIPGHADD
ncbi:MAG: hypothetical protein JWM33_816 [Caulobacteraceae bacterium]|nr:hypothetical protein [Caulobacteraceae bacterium]